MKEISTGTGLLVLIITAAMVAGFYMHLTTEERNLERAQKLWLQGKYDQSIGILQGLLKKDPENIHAHQTLAANYSSKMEKAVVGGPEKYLDALNEYMPMWLGEYETTLSLAIKKNSEGATAVVKDCYFNLKEELKQHSESYTSLVKQFAKDPKYLTRVRQMQKNFQQLIDLVNRYENSFPSVIDTYAKDEELFAVYESLLVGQAQGPIKKSE